MNTITIGRHPGNIVVLIDPSNRSSRYHAEIIAREDGSMVIVDKSTLGTSVNGQRLEKGKEYYIYKIDFVTEYLLGMFIVLSSLIGAFITYKIFKLFTGSKRRWRQYLRLYALTGGFAFLGLALSYIPLAIILLFDEGFESVMISGFFSFIFVLFISISYIWSVILWVKANRKFWEISYSMVIFIAIVTFVVMLLGISIFLVLLGNMLMS